MKYSAGLYEFIRWVKKNRWEWHKDGKYWYRSDGRDQWPPQYTATDRELHEIYFGE